jgi:hypothetical protein
MTLRSSNVIRFLLLLCAGVAACQFLYFGYHYSSRATPEERIRFAAAKYLGQRAARAELIRSGKRHVESRPARQVDTALFLASHPSCCRFRSREFVGPTDDGLPFLFDPFGGYVEVSDGRKSLLVYVPGKLK